MYIICLYINSECTIRMAHIIPTRWDMGPHGTDSTRQGLFFKLHTTHALYRDSWPGRPTTGRDLPVKRLREA